MNSSRKEIRDGLQLRNLGELYEKLKIISQSNNLEEKTVYAEVIAEKINEKPFFLILKKLATDTPACKRQAIMTLSKVKKPNEDTMSILISLLGDNDPIVRTEAPKTLVNLIIASNYFEFPEKLLKGTYEEKRCALKSYEGFWRTYPERVIQCLADALLLKGNYAIFKNIINLLAEIGLEYPEEITAIFDYVLQNFGTEERLMILDASRIFAGDHPTQAVQLFAKFIERSPEYIERSYSTPLKHIPELLQLVVDKETDRTFELLKKLAASRSEPVRYAVLKSLHNFEKAYPGGTLEVLFELWQNASDQRLQRTGDERVTQEDELWQNAIDQRLQRTGDERVTQEEVVSRFVEIGVLETSKAFSILKMLATSGDRTRRNGVLAATTDLATKAPNDAFLLLETLAFDLDYDIKKDTISFLGEKWNIFKEKTVEILKRVVNEEIENLQTGIEAIFVVNKDNPDIIVELLKKQARGESKSVFDLVCKTAALLYPKKEEIPAELLLDGTTVVLREIITYLYQNMIENWENGAEILKKLSENDETIMRIVSIEITPHFLSMRPDTVFEILETLASDEYSEIRRKAFELIIKLNENYPNKSFEIVNRIYSSSDPNVRTDVAKYLCHFRKNFEKESFLLLKKYVRDPDPGVRAQVAFTISEYTDSFPQESLEIIEMCCQDESASVQRAAFEFLEEYIEENSEEVLALVERLHFKYCDATTRERIAICLGSFGEKHTRKVIKIIEDLARDQNRSVRFSAFSSFDRISKYEPGKAMEALTALVIEIDPEIRQKVMKSIGILCESYPSLDLDFLEHFLQDEDIPVTVELALTLGKAARIDPKKTTEIFRKMVLSMRNSMVGEAIAEAMANYGKYCPYEAMKILLYLSRYPNDMVSRRANWSLHSIRKENSDISYMWQAFYQQPFSKLDKMRFLDIIEKTEKNIMYDDKDSYAKELAHRYSLYSNLLRSSTVKKINILESSLVSHIENFELFDGSIRKAFLILKDIAFCLGRQEFYSKRDDKIENLKDCLNKVAEAEGQFSREFNEFDNPDYSIFQLILEAWRNIISAEFVRMRGKAELDVFLESREAMKRESNIVRLKLTNRGISKAENIIVSIHSLDDYNVLGPHEKTLKILSPNESDYVEFRIRVNVPKDSLRVAFTIMFDDAEKESKEAQFADQIIFIQTKHEYIEISNPYIPGIPLRYPDMFYGRDELLSNIENTLRMTENAHILILHGQRRTGKTSILYQLKLRLKEGFLPVILDFQGIPIDLETGGENNEDIPLGLRVDSRDQHRGLDQEDEDIVFSDFKTDSFFHWMAFEIWRELSRRKIAFPKPTQDEFSKNPAFYFRDIFLQEVKERLGDNRLVFMMDEFEAIDYRIRDGKIDRNILTFMRNLMQHFDRMDFIFSGTHRLSEMSSDYWSILFNIGLHHRISFLKENEAKELICDPVRGCMEYDPLAVDKILEMTAGHPYFVQLICYYLVNHKMRAKQNYATIEDVNDVLEDVVIAGTSHFQYFWNRMENTERIVLLALTEILSLQSVSTSTDISNCMHRHHREIEEQRLREIIEKFLNEEILEQKSPGHYKFKIELIRLWCEKNKDLYEIMEVSE